MMTYKETMDYLYAQLPLFSHSGAAAYKKDLHNTLRLAESVNNPHNDIRTVHVAGTNGKGSTCHLLAAILQEAGYKTGLYTSPHIKDFRERIRINGEMISEQFIIDFTARTKQLSEEINPSFFELTAVMALSYFAQEGVDIAIIETGMGGMLDSTNIITPVLSVITNIGHDHKDLLGNTLEEIAVQKAGIIKKEIPVVIGETLPETRGIFSDAANKTNSKIFFAKDHFTIEYIEPAGSLLLCNIKDLRTNIAEKLRIGLAGLYQARNACTVLSAVHELNQQGFEITEVAIHSGFENVTSLTGLRGRWEILQNHPHVIADVGHNADGIQWVIRQLQEVYPLAKLHFIIGFVKDKELDSVLQLFPDNGMYYFTNAHIPRAMIFAELKAKAKSYGLNGEGYDDVNEAVSAAKAAAGPEDVIMICGSFFIVAELKDF